MRVPLLFLISIAFIMETMSAKPTVSYSLAMSKPVTHLLEVGVTFDGLDPADTTLEVSLPNWRTGRYLILDLAGGVVEFNAINGRNDELRSAKTNKSTWRIETRGATSVRVRYKVYANEFSLRTRVLNDEHAFVDGAAVFMYSEKFSDLPLTVTVVPFGSWHVTTGLDSVAEKPNTFVAPNYEYLADCPLEIGNQKDFPFRVRNKDHVLSIVGKGNYDETILLRDISKLVETNAEFWGGLPYERFVFMLTLSPSAGGGTEHINSTAMGSKPFIFKNPDAYLGFLGLVSHEFFHTWNVKRLRPAAINKYDWSKENYTKELWIAEGTTSYYGGLMLVRAGFLSETQYLGRIAGAVDADRSRPGNLRQSPAESSFDAWIKFWKVTKESWNYETDYYGRGSNVSLLLDLTIRKQSKNKHSLDDVLRLMYKRFPVGKGGYTNSDLQKVSEEISGESLQSFFDDFVYGSKPLPWEAALTYAGLEVNEKIPGAKPWLGIVTSDANNRTTVTRIIAGSPAYESGLNVDDEIVAMDGYKINGRDLTARVEEMDTTQTVRLTVFREDRLREFEISLRLNSNSSVKISKIEKPTSLQKAMLTSWLLVPSDKKGNR